MKTSKAELQKLIHKASKEARKLWAIRERFEHQLNKDYLIPEFRAKVGNCYKSITTDDGNGEVVLTSYFRVLEYNRPNRNFHCAGVKIWEKNNEVHMTNHKISHEMFLSNPENIQITLEEFLDKWQEGLNKLHI